jgi:tRNA (guanine-N7-)-methyltransferase
LHQIFCLGKQKLMKFAAVKEMARVYDKNPSAKGKWNSDHFQNPNPIILELACGKGDYTLGMARLFPDQNFIGADIKGHRIWSACRIADLENLQNVAFVRDQIDHLREYFSPAEVSEIWITFPDPFLRISDTRRRLTSKKFLEIYKQVLRPGGLIHLKTDSTPLYEFTKEVLDEVPSEILVDYPDVYTMQKNEELFGIQTYYEKMHLRAGLKIQYLCFRLL